MRSFESDLAAGTWPEYVFIEPSYDTGHEYINGNSMHPLNDIRKGELLVKRVYEAIRASRLWTSTLLVITFDEHGGFYDHVPPPAGIAPGGDARYANPVNDFAFDLLGVRVPTIAVSAYTAKGTVIGQSAVLDCYDHTAVLSTLEHRFGLPPLTQRDGSAPTLAAALNLESPRLSAEQARMKLPGSPAYGWCMRIADFFRSSISGSDTPLSESQRVQLTLAHACNLRMLEGGSKPEAQRRYLSIRRKQDAADYIKEVEERVTSRRAPHRPLPQ